MKRYLIYGLALAGLVFGSCQSPESDPVEPDMNPMKLTLTVEGIATGSGIETRATVDPADGEANVDDLHLLFFNGDGKFVQDYAVPTSALKTDGTPFELAIGRDPGKNLSHSESYSILAYANLSGYAGLPASLEGKSEAEVRASLLELPASIDQGALPMTGTTVKMAGQESVTLALTRAVARFDVRNAVRDYFDLVSVSVYGAAEKTNLWGNAAVAGQTYTRKFYGVGSLDSPLSADLTGGLYAFENFVGNPAGNRDKTTALVLGVQAKAVDGKTLGGMTEGKVYYYRIDVHPQDAAQNLKRNHVYLVTFRGVTGSGEQSEAGAAVDTNYPPDYTINNWDLDDDGLIVTDGTNTMAIPSKYIRFGPEAESREYVIYTVGEGTLKIIGNNLPTGVTAKVSGNRLTVTVEALTGEDERKGTITLGFGGLRGTVEVVQSPSADLFLRLNRTELPIFDAVNKSGIVDEPKIVVSASGAWTAKIYNLSDDENPGFSFANGSMVEDWDSDTDGGDPLDIFTTGPNPSNELRRGFVLFTLKADPRYRQVLMMTQDSKAEIRITQAFDRLPFDVEGITMLQGASGAMLYRIDVLPGTSASGLMRGWDAELTGADASLFTLTKTEGRDPAVSIEAIGTDVNMIPRLNLRGRELEAFLVVSLRDGMSSIKLPITQEKLNISVKRKSALEKVPVKGSKVDGNYSDYVEYEIKNLPAVLKWSAEITKQSLSSKEALPYRRHEGYLIDAAGQKITGNKVENQASTATLRVGFDKIYYPLVHWANSVDPLDNNVPEVTIHITIPRLIETGDADAYTLPVIVQQEPLVARDINIGDVRSGTGTARGDGWGSLNGGGSAFTLFMPVMTNTNNFGPLPASVVRTNADITTGGLKILRTNGSVLPDNGQNYVHAGASNYDYDNNLFTEIEEWRKTTDGIVFFVTDDDDNNAQTNPYSTLTQLGYVRGSNASSTYPSITTVHQEKRVMKFLLNGPFGEVETLLGYTFTLDGTHGHAKKEDLLGKSSHAVIVITEVNNADKILFSIDPVNRVVYLGDGQMLGEGDWGNANKVRFRANFISVLVNTAQYGSHFIDLLREDCEVPLYVPYRAAPVAPVVPVTP